MLCAVSGVLFHSAMDRLSVDFYSRRLVQPAR
jgi:hypothetical protein